MQLRTTAPLKFASMFLAVAVAFGIFALQVLPNVFTPRVAQGAQVDYFLKLGDIKGEASDASHSGWIEIQSFSWGVSQTTTTGSASQGRRSRPDDVVVKKILDKASPLLMKAIATGQHFPEVVLAVPQPGGSDYFTIKLSDVMVSGYSVSGGGDRPTESLSLNFTKIEMEYQAQGASAAASGASAGSVKASWNVKSNTR